jgi:hypothetical protein
MRRIAAYIYKKAGRWKQSIALLKKDKLYKDCMETCYQSGDQELAEDLLVYFIEQVCIFVRLSLFQILQFDLFIIRNYIHSFSTSLLLTWSCLLSVFCFRGRKSVLLRACLLVMI